jgi:hypothetical protein
MSFLNSKASLILAPWSGTPAVEEGVRLSSISSLVTPAGGEKRKTNFGDVLADRL